MYDILIQNAHAITLDGSKRVIPECSIAIEAGKIASLRPALRGRAKKIIDARGCVALPGLVNCHTHVYQSLIEGIGYDMHFSPWNLRYLLPIVCLMGPEASRTSAELAALEMIKSGTTTFSDHWYLHTDFANIEEVSEAFREAGLRHHCVFGFLNESFAGRKPRRAEAGRKQRRTRLDMVRNDEILLKQARTYIEKWHGRGRTVVALGPGSTEDISREFFEKIIALAGEMEVAIATHIAGWIEVVSNSLVKRKMRDLEYAHSLGFTGPRSVAIHAVWLSDEEINILARTGTKVVHNPVANMHLGYGIAPVAEMLARRITVGLGTDGAASYTYDMLEVGKTAAMLQKARKLNAEALTAEKTLEMLTLDGARVLGMEEITGSLEVGKRADLILVDLKSPHLLDVAKPLPKILYSARGSDVCTSIIDGNLVMENRRVLTLNEESIMARATDMAGRLIEAAGKPAKELIESPWPEHGASWRLS